MKPPPFEYIAADSIDHALSLLQEHGDEAKIIAGGQSLIPLLNMRMARPMLLIDINSIGGLGMITRQGHAVVIGALVRHVSLVRSPLISAEYPILFDAASCIAHPQIRNRGTVGGSVAHADSHAELPAVIAALDGSVLVASLGKERSVSWQDFFIGHYQSVLTPTEIVTGVRLPTIGDSTGGAFVEYARRKGDFAVAGVAALVTVDSNERCIGVAIAVMGVSAVPLRLHTLEYELTGRAVEDLPRSAITDAVARLDISNDNDDVELYRHEVVDVLIRRALQIASARARKGTA